MVFGLTGCFDAKMVSQVGGKWPHIKVPAPLILTADETAKLTAFAIANPGLVTKIKNQSDAYLAAIEAYNREASEHNKKVVQELGKALGWTEQDILEALKGQ